MSARALAGAALLAVLSACSNGDYASTSQSSAASAGMRPAAAPAAHTGADGYPNINVDTAAPGRSPVRSAEERDRLEAELMALGERQRSTSGGTPQSVIQELQELGRRSKADAERQIESGKAPDQP